MTSAAEVPSSEIGTAGDANRKRILAQLLERYTEARDLVPATELTEPHANLEWILGAKRSASRSRSGPDGQTIEVASLWLQDLALEVDRQAPSTAPDRLANRLRTATEEFLMAFRRDEGAD